MKTTKSESQHPTRPVKAKYDLATLGSKTRDGGEVVTASAGMVVNGHRIACVTDLVRYPDGGETVIDSGAGVAATYKGRPLAVVGSTTDNGDTLISSLQSDVKVIEYADDSGIPGLLDPDYPSPGEVDHTVQGRPA
ncbi:MAG: PAAR domain-containing protein [Pseudomonas sp.]